MKKYEKPIIIDEDIEIDDIVLASSSDITDTGDVVFTG